MAQLPPPPRTAPPPKSGSPRSGQPGSRPQVWITRTEPGARATADRVRALGLIPLTAPLLAVRDLPQPGLDLTGVAAIAFTSGHAPGFLAPALLAAGVPPGALALPVLAVGEATARAARTAGFSVVRSADGDVSALARLIAALDPAPAGVILHACATRTAGDLEGQLASRGLRVRTLALYETAEVDPAQQVLPDLAGLQSVLVHSPRAGLALAAFLERHPAPDLQILALSEAAAAPLAAVKCACRATAPFPNDASLLSLLSRGSPGPGNESPDP
jgi:uroporphyrinogen-III synthase